MKEVSTQRVIILSGAGRLSPSARATSQWRTCRFARRAHAGAIAVCGGRPAPRFLLPYTDLQFYLQLKP